MILFGPFTQIITLDSLPLEGRVEDTALKVIEEGGIAVENGKIAAVDLYDALKREFPKGERVLQDQTCVVLPGFVDCHTHICHAGSRAGDYARRLSGMSYLEIAKEGGGILDTVKKTRRASVDELAEGILKRAKEMAGWGVTTCEVKSGYGLLAKEELKMLEAISAANRQGFMELVPTCLAAHTRPPEFKENQAYLNHLVDELLPKAKAFTSRLDIFVEESAFSKEEALAYLQKGREMGYEIVVHADQFTRGGGRLAASLNAVSADHLEQSTEEDFEHLAKAKTGAVFLPGATLGLGMPFPPAKKALEAGCLMAIASDWNPGSAPMGDLLTQSALLGAAEKLTLAETLAAITYRPAKLLGFDDRGILKKGARADFSLFPVSDFREIFYSQGRIKPVKTYIQGELRCSR